jgi:hypothetical protein
MRHWDFARLCTGIYRASTSFYPDTPASDVGSLPVDASKEEKTRKQGWGHRFERRSSRNSSRIPEKLSSSLLIVMRNGLLVLHRCNNSKATLLVATSGCAEYTMITSSKSLD